MKTIVVGVDESDGAARALQWAVDEAALHGAQVRAVMAWDWLDQHRPGPSNFDPKYDQDDAEANLHRLVTTAVGDAPVEAQAVCEVAPRALLEASADADLLVVGARGIGGLRGLLTGSVARACLLHATVPIAVVRESSTSGSRHIVVGVDGSAPSQAALRWALAEARRRRVGLDIIHAWLPPWTSALDIPAPNPEDIRRAARAVLDLALVTEDAAGVTIERHVGAGGAAEMIVEAAADAELVVVGRRGHGGFRQLLLGSVAAQVADHAACTVVVVPG